MMELVIFLATIWAFIGFYHWTRFEDNEFGLFDLFIGLPMCILFWPRIKRR